MSINYREWQPINTVPMSIEEVCELYSNIFELSILLGRPDRHEGSSCICGCTCQVTLVNGEWKSIVDPDLRHIIGDYIGIDGATHWCLLPEHPNKV